MPTISDTTTFQTVITTYETNPGMCDDLMDVLQEAIASVFKQQEGFVAAAVHVNDARTRVANYSQWVKRESFLAMIRSEEMKSRNRRLAELCRSFEPVMYEVVKTYKKED